MAKRKEITVRCFVSMDGREPVLLETLDMETRMEVSRRLTAQVAKGLQELVNRNPAVWNEIPEIGDGEVLRA